MSVWEIILFVASGILGVISIWIYKNRESVAGSEHGYFAEDSIIFYSILLFLPAWGLMPELIKNELQIGTNRWVNLFAEVGLIALFMIILWKLITPILNRRFLKKQPD